ncbi:uncharacterized protein LOC126334603 isoform X3 [Schistocerca gregaria]|uniref:uncharacterized protein LOC126334603 isoform X3 n=1 Tax=Schistocerca gregaria TaxID=7010 RepID=UPI00211DA865|nr:uncharacterized protein LOC126334603 isoform X3 [Schistocerca gregaria]
MGRATSMGGGTLLACCCVVLGLVSSAELNENSQDKFFCILKEKTNCNEDVAAETEKVFTSLGNHYSSISEETRKIIENENPSNFSSYVLSSLHVNLLSLLPDSYLQNITGSAVAEVIKTHIQNEAVVIKYLALLNSRNQQKDFLESMVNVTLPVTVQQKLASVMSTWLPLDDWTADDFLSARDVGNPVLAYLPAALLINVPDKTALKFLLHLNEWKGSDPANKWSDKPESVKRIWSYLSARELYPQPLEMWTIRNLKLEGFLLEGTTSDELKKLNLRHSDSLKLISELQLNKIQVRTIFDMLYGNLSEFSLENFDDVRIFIPFLLPMHIQKFVLGLADAVPLTNLVLKMDDHSLPLVKQLFEYHIAKLVLEDKIENEYPESWKQNISYISHFAFLLPKRALQSYSMDSLPIQILSRLATTKLSRKQAELLSGKNDPELLLSLEGFVKSVPSSVISSLEIGGLKQEMLFNLITNIVTAAHAQDVTYLPVPTRMQILTVLQKIRPYLAERSILESIYKSGNPGHFFTFISPKELLEIEKKLRGTLSDVSFEHFAQDFSGLPQNTEYPKDLQYCWLQVLPDYFLMKGKVRGHSATADFTEEVERADTYAIGGFVLGGLSPMIISQAPDRFHILNAIGELSPMELLQSMNNENPTDYATLFVEKHITGQTIELNDLLNMGTLTNFLKVSDINKIQPKAFKLFLEVVPQENKVLCTSSIAMEAWCNLINETFGAPRLWSSSSLASMGDLLIVCPHTFLLDVPETSWINAIDVLTNTTYYHKKGKFLGETSHLSFIQMCLKFLKATDHGNYLKSVKELMHLYLIATQEVLDKIIPAAHIVHANKAANTTKSHNVKFHSVFGRVNEQLTKIEVLNMDEQNRTKRELGSSVAASSKNFNPQNEPGNSLRAAVMKNAHETTEDSRVKELGSSPITEHSNVEDEDSLSATDLQKVNIVSNLTCVAIKASGIGAYLGLKEEDIENMVNDETEECLDIFGALDLGQRAQKVVWNTLGKAFLLTNLLDLGHLVKVMGMNDISEVKLNNKRFYMETIAALGEEIDDPKLIRILATKWLIDNLNKTLPTEAVGALGNIICGLPTPTITDLLSKDRAFAKLLPVLRNIKGCPMMCLQDLAAVAVRNYGDPSTWSSEDISALGVIMAGLNTRHWKSLKGTRGNFPLCGLTSRAVQCLPLNVIKDLTVEQVASLLPSAVSVSEDKFSVLPEQQKEILKKTLRRQERDVINKSVCNFVLNIQTVIMLTILWFHLIF